MDGEKLISRLQEFEFLPYQVAIGGGEPLQHPDFIEILKRIRNIDVIPNYTTNGKHVTPEILDATNKYCGGVALSYHPHKGENYFRKTYNTFKEALKVQLNIHAIVDNGIISTLEFLRSLHPQNIVLLGYLPQGRGRWDRFPTLETMDELTCKIRELKKEGIHLAFSEALMPYFLSTRTPIGTSFAVSSEGYYSAYLGLDWKLKSSSFKPTYDGFNRSKPEDSLQKQWESLGTVAITAEACGHCKHENRCLPLHIESIFLCNRQNHRSLL